MKIALYGRVSKDDGTQDPQNQLAPLRDYAKALGGEIVEEYVDLASGSKSDREAFQRMLNDVDKRKFDLLLVWALDRFSREGISNMFGYVDRFKKHKVQLRSLQESWFDIGDEGVGQVLLAFMSWVAHQERKRLIARTKEGIAKARRNGVMLGRRPGRKDSPGVKRSSHKYYKSFNPKRAKKPVNQETLK